jgi:hypothetical protein
LRALFVTGLAYPLQAIANDPLLIPRENLNSQTAVRVGTVASSQQICEVLNHPIFSRPRDDYRLLDAINSDFRWDGIEAAPLWVEKKFTEAGVRPYRLSLDERSFRIANQNLSNCLERLDRDRKDFYSNLKTFFLQYLSAACYQQEFDIEKTVDDRGNLIQKRTLRQGMTCIDFNYNSGRYGDWNSTTFALMLIWVEAHPVLQRIFDRGYQTLLAQVQQRDQKASEDRLAQLQRQQAFQQRADEADQQWQRYASRTKSFMEQVYNFATTGTVTGTKFERWIEIQKCVMTNGRVQINSQAINMTAFRVSRQQLGNSTYLVSSDGNIRLSTPATIPIDRLQNAWRQAFEECPGTKSRF